MKILIAGGSGLVGSRLTNHLIAQGHDVNVLTRNRFRHLNAAIYEWNPAKDYIEEGALENIDAIVNLAGAGVADKSWTEKRKHVLMDSRVQSANCLCKNLKESPHRPKVIVNASAIGYYGYADASRSFNEGDPAGEDFLAGICVAWEQAADRLSDLGIRLVKLRIGMVLDEKGGALKKMKQPIQLFAGAPLGKGDQMISWIHVEDMYRMIEFVLAHDELDGAYNAVSDSPVSNKEFTEVLAKVLNRPLFLPNIPEFVLKLMLGEMSDIVLKGSSVSNEKIKAAGFNFNFTDLKSSLANLL